MFPHSVNQYSVPAPAVSCGSVFWKGLLSELGTARAQTNCHGVMGYLDTKTGQNYNGMLQVICHLHCNPNFGFGSWPLPRFAEAEGSLPSAPAALRGKCSTWMCAASSARTAALRTEPPPAGPVPRMGRDIIRELGPVSVCNTMGWINPSRESRTRRVFWRCHCGVKLRSDLSKRSRAPALLPFFHVLDSAPPEQLKRSCLLVDA